MGKLNYFEDVDPIDLIDFTILYTDWMASDDQITGSSWVAPSTNPAGGMISSSTFTTGSATVFIISGVAGELYRYENTIGTLQARRINKSIMVSIKDE